MQVLKGTYLNIVCLEKIIKPSSWHFVDLIFRKIGNGKVEKENKSVSVYK